LFESRHKEKQVNEQGALKILNKFGVVMDDDHFVYDSGLHGTMYVSKDRAYPHTIDTEKLCHGIAERFASDQVDAVAAAAIGGIILERGVAYHLSRMTGVEVLGVFAERETVPIPDPEGLGRRCYYETGKWVLKRGHGELVKGKRVLVVEDKLTTGATTRGVVHSCREMGADVVGVGYLFNGGGVTAADVGDVPKFEGLITKRLPQWDEEGCARTGPCSLHVPINVEFGKGREFLARKLGK
jgi:orotate phosphoribosyltransferase